MSTDRARYVPFPVLAIEWAEESGVPPEMVLRNMCDWAVAGGFPPGAFVTATGAQVDGFDIYMSFRAVTETTLFNPTIDLGGYTQFNSNNQWGRHLIAEVLITAQDIVAFCEKTNTRPPPSLLTGFKRIWARGGGQKQLAPPACPDAADCAVKKVAHDYALGAMNGLRGMLSTLQGGKRQVGMRDVGDGPIDFEYWGGEWKQRDDHVRDQIAKCGDDTLYAELESLESQWAAFAAQKTSVAPMVESEVQTTISDSTPNNSGLRRPVGRPPGSGSFKMLDMPLIEEMRAAVLADSSLSYTAAASRCAARAAGAGTEGNRAKRLAQRYSEKYLKS